MRVLVTCGPASEPVDQVRRITNLSTGELGIRLCMALAGAGFEPVCLKGNGATSSLPLEGIETHIFETNDDLALLLDQMAKQGPVAAIFHAAALCDFRVKTIADAHGKAVGQNKIASDTGELHLVLEPAAKLLPTLRPLFPQSLLVGWKYELEGTPETALGRALAQIANNDTDGCVLNGSAYGSGFAFIAKDRQIVELENRPALATFLVRWLQSQLTATAAA